MPLARMLQETLPVQPEKTLTGIRERFHPIPLTKTQLFPVVAISPAVSVPWPKQSVQLPPPLTSTPETYWFTKSGWFGSAPVSRSATIIVGEPVLTSHAAGLPILA